MLQLMQPLFAALVGAALSLFGLLHTVQLFPNPGVWQQIALVTPGLVSVAVFVSCLILAVGGIVLLVIGIRSTRKRISQIRHVPWERIPDSDGLPEQARHYADMDDGWR